MKKITAAICLFLASTGSAFSSPPSDASLSQLIAITDMKQMIDGIFVQFDGMMNGFIQKNLNGQQATESQQVAINNMKTKIVTLLKNEYKWEILEPKFIKIYKDSLTQDEVDGMIAFYKTPSGQTVIKKMPAIMQQSMMTSQSMIQALIPKMQEIQQEFIAEIKAAEQK